ncbi:Putative peptidoglycan binding domain-containing protein [Chryseobacterium oranimense]|uniref:Putative peptidoglycan binding domain-containing protein n=1 Tax=Chryseobacterium oranimense TaxID=421058 RepID=A0A1M5UK80_9FLAO|nr:N-acetylmuramidase family protein [Chryseobacterium oranimense]SHH63351.1 Putative peptidoglycan binding domain-containing protein [Chryseobacterium oranimense]
MKLLKYYTKAPEVLTLCEILYKLGYDLKITDSFTQEVDAAVKDFQRKNSLVVDGIVGVKTWAVLLEKDERPESQTQKFLQEADLVQFADEYSLELAAVKAVNEIESSGKGFLINNKPKILFEGHVFWNELKKRGIDPNSYYNSESRNVLYPKWTRAYYEGGVKEYDRLNEAISLDTNPEFKEAALSSASWGSFQIMGYHAKSLGYADVDEFVSKMELNEAEHLKAFGKFLEKNGCLVHLRSKNWAGFARLYNGAGYKENKYDEKLAKAYAKYSQN